MTTTAHVNLNSTNYGALFATPDGVKDLQLKINLTTWKIGSYPYHSKQFGKETLLAHYLAVS